MAVKEVEFCTNDEWLGRRLDWPEGLDSVDFCKEAANVYIQAAIDHIERHAAGRNLRLITAKGERKFYHGWNGDNMLHHHGLIFGSFAKLSKAEVALLEAAEQVGCRAANVYLSGLAAHLAE